MDQDRQIRYLIPPFFFFASLLLGAWCGGTNLSVLLTSDRLAAVAVAILPLGFLFGQVSVLVLGAFAWWLGWPTYEAVADEDTLKRILNHIHPPDAVGDLKLEKHAHARRALRDPKLVLFTVATFDHEVIDSGIHTWIMRRWNAFNVCVSSCVALVAAQGVGTLLSIPERAGWVSATIGALAVFGWTAVKAWHQVMDMIEFQSHREHRCTTPPPDTALVGKAKAAGK